jgi:hypothetical protein
MSGIERDTEERGRARVSLPDGARMRTRRSGRSRSPDGRGASTGGEVGHACRVGVEVLAGGVRLRGQGRQRGGERRLVGGGRRQREGGRGLDFGTLGFLVRAWESDGDWVGSNGLEVGFRLVRVLYTKETRSEPSDPRSTAVKSWAIWATWASLLIIFLFLFSFCCTIVK